MVRDKQKNFKVIIIPNRYKNTLDNFIDNSDLKFSDCARQIDMKSCNAPKSENVLANLLKRDCLDKNIQDKASKLMPKTRNLQVYQCRVVTISQIKYKKS